MASTTIRWRLNHASGKSQGCLGFCHKVPSAGGHTSYLGCAQGNAQTSVNLSDSKTDETPPADGHNSTKASVCHQEPSMKGTRLKRAAIMASMLQEQWITHSIESWITSLGPKLKSNCSLLCAVCVCVSVSGLNLVSESW